MEISQYILDEAKDLLQAGQMPTLPMQLPSAPAFYLAVVEDSSIIAFAAFRVRGVEYKIGTMKAA